MVVILLRWIVSIWIPMEPYELAWLFLVGFTWGSTSPSPSRRCWSASRTSWKTGASSP